MPFEIGDEVIDEDGGKGVVAIIWDDGDIVTLPGGNCAAHPNPTVMPDFPTPEECRRLRGKKPRPDPVEPGR